MSSNDDDAYNSGYLGGYTHQPGSGDAYNRGLQDGGHNSNPGSCFPGDALVRTPEGDKRLDTLQKGDVVVSWQESSQRWVHRRIKTVKSYGLKPIVAMTLEDGRVVRVTTSHTIRTVGAWKRVGALGVGDVIETGCGGAVSIKEIVRVAERVPVFNLHCYGEYTFVADGVIAHSFTVLRRTRTVLHQLFDALDMRSRKSGFRGQAPRRAAVDRY
jgi:hypothetical protein